jgi:hypothetical protein
MDGLRFEFLMTHQELGSGFQIANYDLIYEELEA